MIATKLIVNRKPSLSPKKRSQVRAQVRQLEIAAANGINAEELRDLANKAAQRVGQLGRFHKTPAASLKNRIAIVRGTLPPENQSAITGPTIAPLGQEPSTTGAMPWE